MNSQITGNNTMLVSTKIYNFCGILNKTTSATLAFKKVEMFVIEFRVQRVISDQDKATRILHLNVDYISDYYNYTIVFGGKDEVKKD